MFSHPEEAGDVSPLGQRPLGVMSALYRLYAALRLQDVMQWQESVLQKSQFGFRPGYSTDDVYHSISLSIEEALLDGSPLIGLHFDYRKAFDLVPRNILFNLAHRLGFSPSLLGVMQSMYSGLQRFFKIPGGLSTPSKSSCGILQGCSLSVIFMNIMMSIWAKVISHESSAEPRAFADDSIALSNSIAAAHDALNLTGEFATLTNQELAHRKTVAWATTSADRQALRRIRYQGHRLQVFFDIKSLGAQLCSSKARRVAHYAPRFQQAHKMAQNVASFPLSSSDRGLICAAKILPKVLFASEISVPAMPDLGKLRSAIARAVWRQRASRSPDVVFSLLHPIHRLDPKAAWVYQCVSQLRRTCLRRPDILEAIRRLWQKSATNSGFGPVSTLKNALRQFGWSWTVFENFDLGSPIPFSWLKYSKGFFQHQLREGLRAFNFKVAGRRQDLQGIQHKCVDRHTLSKIMKRMSAYHKGTFEAILAGGFRSAVQFCKAGLVEDPMCPFCGQTQETVEHIFLQCPAWTHVRLAFPEVQMDWLRVAPQCTRLCAVPLVPEPILTFSRNVVIQDDLEISVPI